MGDLYSGDEGAFEYWFQAWNRFESKNEFGDVSGVDFAVWGFVFVFLILVETDSVFILRCSGVEWLLAW